jgi:hypothetical protein
MTSGYRLTLTLLAASALTPISLNAQAVNSISVNGVLNPVYYSGTDIGAQINAAWASGQGKTVRVPAGTYSFSTTIVHPGTGYMLICDTGATLQYNGSSDAITLANGNLGADQNAGIDGDGGCSLKGTSAAASGIHIFPSNHTFVRNIRISGFTSGYGIKDTGGNSVELTNISAYGNKTGIYVTGETIGSSGYAANAVHLSDSDISANSQWGFDSDNSGCGCTNNLGNTLMNNVFEGNGSGDIYLNWDYGAVVMGNYFESAGPGVEIGNTQNTWGITVRGNYFSSFSTTGDRITIGYGDWFNIEENAEYGATGGNGCFIDVTTGGSGSAGDIRGVGTNRKMSAHEWCLHGTGTTTP